MDADDGPAPLKVAFITQTYHPVIGGAERQLQRLLPGIESRGVQPVVITRGLPGAPREETVDGVPVVRGGSVRQGAWGSLRFFLTALRELRRQRPDVVYALSLMTPAMIGVAHRAFGGSPMLVKALRGGALGDHDRIHRKPGYRLRCRLLRRGVDAAQVISDEIDEEFALIGVPAERRHRIRNGVDVTALAPGRDGTGLRASLDIAPEAPLFVYVGRLAAEKRVDLLIDAFERLGERHPDARLLVVGDGPERDRLRSAATDDERVILFGPTDDVAEILAAADVYVLPSSTEGMSNSLLEAMAAGLPIVATDVGAARELLGDEERGWVVPPENASALERAMLAALEERTTRERGERARRYVSEHHSLDDTAERLVRLCRELARSAVPGPDGRHGASP